MMKCTKYIAKYYNCFPYESDSFTLLSSPRQHKHQDTCS